MRHLSPLAPSAGIFPGLLLCETVLSNANLLGERLATIGTLAASKVGAALVGKALFGVG